MESFWNIGLKCIFCNFLKKYFFEIFENSPASGELRPRTPYEAGHNIGSPRNFFPADSDGCNGIMTYISVAAWADYPSIKSNSLFRSILLFFFLFICAEVTEKESVEYSLPLSRIYPTKFTNRSFDESIFALAYYGRPSRITLTFPSLLKN